MSPLPRETADRWHARPDPAPGKAHLYWHILVNDQPDVRALAALAQQRLAFGRRSTIRRPSRWGQNLLGPWIDAIQDPAQAATGNRNDAAKTGWTPHVTVAYSTAVQAAGPIIAALGRELPECKITVSSVSLIAQHGPERQWGWRPVAEAQLGDAPSS